MTQHHTRTLAALAGAFCLVLGAIFWWQRGPSVDEPDPQAAVAPGDLATAPRPAAPLETLSAPRSAQGSAATTNTTSVESSVAWAVKIELEMLRGSHVPKADGAPPMGSGAQARFKGRLQRGESGVTGTVTFTGGGNAGRVLTCSEAGEFGAIDLYPGLAEVHVQGPGIEARREVRLRLGYTEELNISFDLPGQVFGEVFDREGKGIEAVDVELDGQHAFTDADGLFHFRSATSGDAVQLVLRKAGLATQSTRISVAAGRTIEKGRHTFTMHPAATLELTLGPRVGNREDAIAILLPEVTNTMRTYPWQRISPARIKPGQSLRFDDLPAMRITVRVYHDGAFAEPESATVFLQPGVVERHLVNFQPAPSFSGIVQDPKGLRIENARVVCEAPDRTGATMQYLQSMPRVLEEEMMPTMPPAASEARTNFNGEFTLSRWPKLGEVRYLWAQSADGRLWGGRAIRSDETQVTLVIEPVEEGRAALSLEFPNRHQGLPVVVTIGGRPREEVMVAAGEPLTVGGLATGTWRVRASWNGRSLFGTAAHQDIDIESDRSYVINLPEGAIEGQDADTLLRAGRSLPTSLVPISNDGR